MRLEGKYTIAKIIEALQSVACSNIDQNMRLFNFADEVVDAFNAAFGTGFGRKVMTLKEIKKILARLKILILHNVSS